MVEREVGSSGRERRVSAQVIGPGILFAGAAVGVSHLVQSTRAGAGYGLSLLVVVIVANILKYPAFSFGPRYAAATGTSLLEGYRRKGVWALVVYAVLTVGTMFTVQAAVTVVTAGLILALFGWTANPVWVSAGIIAVSAALVGAGGYRWLDRLVKVAVAVLTVLTLIATALVLPRIQWDLGQTLVPTGRETVLFVAALVGWMPSAIDVAVWSSLWTLAKKRTTGHAPSVRESLLDFNVGYAGTAALALCFLLLGAGIFFGSGEPLPAGVAPFAARVIDLYGQSLGAWSRPVIGVAALLVMFSTTLTVVDGFPRALSTLALRFRRPEVADDGNSADETDGRRAFWVSLAVLAVGSVLVLRFFLVNLKSMVDLATTLSFLSAPVLAVLNHRAVCGPEVPAAARPGRGTVIYSGIGIASLGMFALYYLYLRFLS